MSLRFRRSLKIAPGLRLIVSKKGLGLNLGSRGAHLTVNTQGQVTRSIGIPGTGLSDIERVNLRKKTKSKSSKSDEGNVEELIPQIQDKPLLNNYPSIFASSNERTFFGALTAHQLTNYESLFKIPELELVLKSIAIQLAIKDDKKLKDASLWLKQIWEERNKLSKDKLFKKYVEKIIVAVPIAPGISYSTNLNIDALGLIYAEVLQQLNNPKLAKEIIEEVQPNQVTAVSLAEIEIQLEEFDEVLTLTNDIENEDDATALLLIFRGIALRELKHFEASRTVLSQALKSKKRNEDILHKGYLERSKTYLKEGKKTQAKVDLERIIAQDSEYPGLKELLSKL
jgi:tetratricopeptide (TPR) repeat protein